jgi:hypothetical protein
VRAAEPAEDFGLIGRRVHADLVRLERFRFVWLIVIVALFGLPFTALVALNVLDRLARRLVRLGAGHDVVWYFTSFFDCR